MKMKKGHELKIRERLSKSYLQVIFMRPRNIYFS